MKGTLSPLRALRVAGGHQPIAWRDFGLGLGGISGVES